MVGSPLSATPVPPVIAYSVDSYRYRTYVPCVVNVSRLSVLMLIDKTAGHVDLGDGMVSAPATVSSATGNLMLGYSGIGYMEAAGSYRRYVGWRDARIKALRATSSTFVHQ